MAPSGHTCHTGACTCCWALLGLLARAETLFDNSSLLGAKDGVRIRTVSWNVAAVNNNPFEYWITHPNPKYKDLMDSMEKFIQNPGLEDVRVDEVFQPAMFQQLLAQLRKAGVASVEPVIEHWDTTLSKLGIVSGFLKNGEIGKKRLVSMPDRVSNTIQTPSGDFQFRPTVINCYPQSLGTAEEWWEKWLTFFFEAPVEMGGKSKTAFSMMQKIKKAKYPAITEKEEQMSIPLQMVYVAVFDAILIHLMNSKGGDIWQDLRRDICTSLNVRKSSNLLSILQTTYQDADVIFLQEAGNQLVEMLRGAYATTHWLALPGQYNTKRNQNSIILLSKALFSEPMEIEAVGSDAGLEAGDLLLLKTLAGGGDINYDQSMELALASFHGDTNGLLTEPALKVVLDALRVAKLQPLLFGLDANTYEAQSSSTAHVLKWENAYLAEKLLSSTGPVDPTRHTTFNARTYLQPQLNKAASSSELKLKGDKNPKDFILATRDHFLFGNWWRDNTGNGQYDDELVFPTLDFPSDHAAIASECFLLWGTQPKTEL